MFCIIAGLEPVLECDGDEEAAGVSADTSRSYPLTPQARRNSVVLGITFAADGLDSLNFHGSICCCVLVAHGVGDVTEVDTTVPLLLPLAAVLPNLLANFNGNFCLT